MLKKAQQICKKIAVKITDIAVFMVVLPSTSFATSIGSGFCRKNSRDVKIAIFLMDIAQ